MGWNLAGLYLLSQGQPALGPTASWAFVAVLAVLGLVLIAAYTRFKWLYVIVSLILVCGAYLALLPALDAENASLWPSAFWRYAGAALNAIGVIGGMTALAAFIGSLRTKYHNL